MSCPPVERVLALCDEWDGLSRGETPTTRRIREAIQCACPHKSIAGCDHDPQPEVSQ